MKRFNFNGIGKQFKDVDEKKNEFSSNSMSSNKVFEKDVIGDTPFLKFSDGSSYVVRFVPYQVDATHPLVRSGRLDDGDAAYCLNFDRHSVGQNFESMVCPKGTYGERCPVCEKAYALKDDDAESAKALYARRRVLYNVVVLKEAGKLRSDRSVVSLIHESQYLFEQALQEELSKHDEDEEDGSGFGNDILSLCVGATDKAHAKALRIRCEGSKLKKKFIFQVVPMKDAYDTDDDELLAAALPLHKCLHHPTAKELQSMLSSVMDEDEDDEDDDEDEAPRRRAPGPERKDEDVQRGGDDDEDEDEDEAPAPRREPEDGGPAASDGADASGECPFKHKFGKDVNVYDDCDACDAYEACLERKREMRKRRA